MNRRQKDQIWPKEERTYVQTFKRLSDCSCRRTTDWTPSSLACVSRGDILPLGYSSGRLSRYFRWICSPGKDAS